MKIDLLVGENTYNSTHHFSSAFAHALRQCGATSRLHWVGEGHFFHAFYEILEDPPDCTFSFSDIHASGTPLGALWQIPHFFFLLDPAIYFLHQMRSPFTHLSCVDPGDCAFVRSLGHSQVGYLPHAADRRCLTPPSGERPYDVVFFGSCAEYETEDETVLAAAQRVLSPEPLSILQSLVALGVADEALPRYHAWVDFYVRFKDRLSLLRSIKAGQLHIWGRGPWKRYLPHAHVHAPIPFDETLRVMQQARVVVNSSLRFPKGLHERLVYAPLCGAATLSHQGSGYRYTPGVWEEQSGFQDWQERAYAEQVAVLSAHTWEHRAEALLAYAREKRLF